MIGGIKEEVGGHIRGKVSYDEPMERHTSFRIGGPADIWVEPEDVADLKTCIGLSSDRGVPLFVIGNGSNLLVRDEGIRGIVVNMSSPSLKNIYWGNRKVSVTSSITLREFLDFCSSKGLGGLEFLTGIPGSVGGAVMTNAGARHYKRNEEWLSISDFIDEIRVMDHNGDTMILDRDKLSFGYKQLDLKDNVILEAKFLLSRATKEDVIAESRRFLKRKKETQALNLPSAGCIFKNPTGCNKSAGQLIDECDLKGAKIGGAEISKKHANFIINMGHARSRDVMALIDLVRYEVKNRFSIDLSLEIRIV
jgi:UDP-N-acetylmuramate dehydrogenase